MADTVARAKARIAASKARIDAAMEKTRRRIEASNDNRVLEKGGQTVCSLVEALKQKSKPATKKSATKKSKPATNKAIRPRNTIKVRAPRKPPASDPCEDIGTARKLIRCLDRCCAKSKQKKN